MLFEDGVVYWEWGDFPHTKQTVEVFQHAGSFIDIVFQEENEEEKRVLIYPDEVDSLIAALKLARSYMISHERGRDYHEGEKP